MYLNLRQVLDILFATEIVVGELDLLKVLISEYLEIRCSIFRNDTMKNKHYHLIYYQRLIQFIWPMVHYWYMHFEQEHQRYKMLMHISNNF